MKKLTLKEIAVPLIKSIDTFNYLLKSHHRRTAIISYYIGKNLNLSMSNLCQLVIAASLHDIGALSVVERDMLIQNDVENPTPHCIMGHNMLVTFDKFQDIAEIIRHHHVNYAEAVNSNETLDIKIQSYIIHLADRVDILLSSDRFVLSQKKAVTEQIVQKSGTLFRPDIVDAFLAVSKADIFWIDINNMTMDQLFAKINYETDIELDMEAIKSFAYTLSKIVDFRSSFTASHSYTVARIAFLLGKIFSLDALTCDKLMIAGYLHDIGKIGIDPGLLEKAGKLSEEEFNMLKLHSYYTEQILKELSASEWFSDIVIWSKYHHEKVDGSGYPYAIQGATLDLGTRILAFSDIIAALMEPRPYREKMDIDTAFTLIDEKLAPPLSSSMFTVIKQHKATIAHLVSQCQKHLLSEADYIYLEHTS